MVPPWSLVFWSFPSRQQMRKDPEVSRMGGFRGSDSGKAPPAHLGLLVLALALGHILLKANRKYPALAPVGSSGVWIQARHLDSEASAFKSSLLYRVRLMLRKKGIVCGAALEGSHSACSDTGGPLRLGEMQKSFSGCTGGVCGYLM